MSQSFETVNEAEMRTPRQIEEIKRGVKRPHDHVGNLEKYDWQSQDCLEYVNSLEEGSYINYSDLARRFGLNDSDEFCKGNIGQVVKKFLLNNCIDLNSFSTLRKGCNINVRRQKKRLSFNEKVSLPIEQTNKQVSTDLKI